MKKSALNSTLNGSLQVSFGGYSTKGRKPENQDAFAVRYPEGNALIYKGVVACLADGVSCSDNGQKASHTAVTNFIHDYYSTPDTWGVKKSAAKVLASLNSWLFHHSRHENTRSNGLVTTFSAVVIKSNSAHIFHVGDSRIYLLREGKLRQLTRDHNHHVTKGTSYLTRALGMDSHLEVDYCIEDLQCDDVLLMSSDGFHESLSHHSLQQILPPIAQQEEILNIEEEAKRLVNSALEKGVDDNCSCLLLRIKGLPAKGLGEVQRQLSEQVIPPVLDVGQRLDDYEVIRVLHSGPRSHVYLVSHPSQPQSLVLKVPSQHFADDQVYLEAFVREEWVGRRVNHSGVMKILSRPVDSSFLYHLCEYIDGQSLRQWLYDHPAPSLTVIRDLVARIIPPLRALQRAGVVHGDLKPENLMLTDAGSVVILDFGAAQVMGLQEISQHEQCRQPLGALDYMAPEHFFNNNIDSCADIFSLAVIVYEMLTGKLPFTIGSLRYRQPASLEHWRYRSMRGIRADIPAWIDKAVEKGLNPKVQYRYQALSEFQMDISSPNSDLTKDFEPLFQKNPLLGWQLLSWVLMAAIVAQWILLD